MGKWSEWQDLNLRPPRPERGALPGCATLRDQTERAITLRSTTRRPQSRFCAAAMNFRERFRLGRHWNHQSDALAAYADTPVKSGTGILSRHAAHLFLAEHLHRGHAMKARCRLEAQHLRVRDRAAGEADRISRIRRALVVRPSRFRQAAGTEPARRPGARYGARHPDPATRRRARGSSSATISAAIRLASSWRWPRA